MESPWEGLQEFLTVVETGGFTAASRRLGVSASHVSRQVARLEDRIGIKLLARTTRVVRLTEAGADYHARVADLAAGVEEANQAAAGAQAELAGRIRVSAGGAFAEEHVAPALAAFARDHPRITIELDFGARNVDLVDEGFDFAIRYGVLAESRLIARRLAGRQMVCAASPGYLAASGTPAHPSELRRHSCLRLGSDRWHFTDPQTGDPIVVRIGGRWSANSGKAVRAAAVAGLGITYIASLNVRDALDSGALVPLLEGYEDRTRSSWIVYPERRHMPLRVRRAIDHLLDVFRGQ